MRTLNRGLLQSLVGGVVALSAAVWWVHGWQTGRIVRWLRAEADRAEAAGDPAAARDVLGRLLAIRPTAVEDRARYAALVEQTAVGASDLAVARREYESALQAEPGRTEVRRRPAELDVAPRRTAEARTHLRALRRGRTLAPRRRRDPTWPRMGC